MAASAEAVKKITSERLHNQNCHAYLLFLKDKIPESVLEGIRRIDTSLAEKLEAITTNYSHQFPYSDVYKKFFKVVENNIEALFDKPYNAARRGYLYPQTETEKNANANKIQRLEQFILSIYANDNHILKNTFKAIKHIPLGKTPNGKSVEKDISKFLQDSGFVQNFGKKINRNSMTPAEAGSDFGRFTAMTKMVTRVGDFKSQHDTSLATLLHYGHMQPDSPPQQYRMGTQAQLHNGKIRISPLFKRWLTVQANNAESSDITHIYFNNLGWHRPGKVDFEGKAESDLTEALHDLENQHKNLIVITLPADKGLMALAELSATASYKRKAVFNELLQIASDPAKGKENDFYISLRARALLFKDDAKLKELMTNSFKALGFDQKESLSSADRQAVWFHFNKFALPNYIIDTLQPKGFNFSCKDAIDRGGVSSAYYNLMKSIDKKNPLNREEFERALHAAPAMVKGRGMNHHIELIWNAVDAYIEKNAKTIKSDPSQRWLFEWRNLNCPHERIEELLARQVPNLKKNLPLNESQKSDLIWERVDDYLQKNAKDIKFDPEKNWLIKWRDFHCPHEKAAELLARRIPEVRQQLEDGLLDIHLTEAQTTAIKDGVLLLNAIQEQSNTGVSGKRLLLEVVIRTPDRIFKPQDTVNAQHYDDLTKELAINHPLWYQILGYMKAIIGGLFSQTWEEKGFATAKAGEYVETRNNVIQNIKDIKEKLDVLKNSPAPTTSEIIKSETDEESSEGESFHM